MAAALERVQAAREKARHELKAVKLRLQIVLKVEGNQSSELLEELDELCKQIAKKDRDVIMKAMFQRDDAKRRWLQSWVQGEVADLARRDRDDMKNGIQMHNEDLEKMHRLLDKFKLQQAE
mmetsp:Transcript_7184/g.5458  ORF Transcript_7184/g.5458 Transcript_7184/m.5458 type:complete len:121 (+) Transcript_7184:1458-1820(+)